MMEWFRRHIGRVLAVTLALGFFLMPAAALATTQVGNAVLQAWYRMRHTFHTDSFDHVEWVQWRNEVFGWLVYDNLVEDGLLFNQIELPLVKYATFNARYRFRYDPVYEIRGRFDKIYDDEEKDSFIIPENGFRDLFIDLDFEQVGPGRLSVRVGNQQIVWGESDLFRSLDIINPLRIDQNGPAGEKFDEFRSPTFAIKFLYDLGTIGTWFSDVAIEPFYTPRFRTGTSELIVDKAWRVPFHWKGCLDDNDKLIPYDRIRCAQPRSDGSRIFVPYQPGWQGHRRTRHPWGLTVIDPVFQQGSIDFGCLTQECSPDVFGQRISAMSNLIKGNGHNHHLRGSGLDTSAAGVRILAKTFFNVDFTLNYLFMPSPNNGVPEFSRLSTGFVGNLRPDVVYGDFGIIPDGNGGVLPPAGDFAEGLRRCLSDTGKAHETKSKDRGAKVGTFLTGADLWGYNHPSRFRSNNPKGALDDDGNPLPGRHQAARPPITVCGVSKHDYSWTHVTGFTATYNDFQYTGAIFRFEESLSSKEPARRLFVGTGRLFNEPLDSPIRVRQFRNNGQHYTRVWRSMVGFDLVKAFSSLRYIPGMPRTMYENQSFFTGQWLMQNNWDNIANNLCLISDNLGNALTKEDERRIRAETGQRVYGHSQCRTYRWNHLLTFAWAGYGFFGGKLETRNAVAFEPRGHQWLVFTQNWWRNLFGFRDWEVSFGISWQPGTRWDDSWSGLMYYADRDQFWFETTYYLL